MGGEAVRLGPFTGGLNTISDPTTIADVELAECLNFEQDLDGSLKSRPPFKEIAGHANFTERTVFLNEAVFGSDHYLIASNVNGVYHFINGAFTLITNTFEAGAAVQYADKVYLVPKPGSANPGGKWDPSAGFTAVAAIPQGQAAVVHKERLYICPGIKSTTNYSRLKFSDPSNLDSYPAGNFIDVRQGDGTKLVDLTVYQDNLLLFKEQSSHLLAYDTRPDDAVLRPISDTIGVNRQWNVVNYENQVYIFSGGWVYEITNLDFLRLNVKVPFIRDETSPSAFSDEFIFLCLLGDRLVCRYYKKVYVYGLRTRTWSEWESKENTLHYFGPISVVRPATGDEWYAGSNIQSTKTVVQFFDKSTSTTVEMPLSASLRLATANNAGSVSTFVTTDADSSDMNIGDYVQLYTSGDVLKEGTVFRITAKASAGGNTTVSFTPNAAVSTASTNKMKTVPRVFCSAKTKNFDMAISHQFKRLWWWGASISTNNEIFGLITPITTSFLVTWDDLANYTWDQLYTWDQPLQAPTYTQTIIPTGQGVVRQAVKFLKSIRYLQVNFKVQLTTVGNTADGPAKLFTMIAWTEPKQVVSKAVS